MKGLPSKRTSKFNAKKCNKQLYIIKLSQIVAKDMLNFQKCNYIGTIVHLYLNYYYKDIRYSYLMIS